MEPAKIDWKTLDSVFTLDQVYENINAPQWFDFLTSNSPHNDDDDDDVVWFCRSDCKHPRTAEDFLKSSPSSKLLRSVSFSKLIGLADWTRREATNLKRRGVVNNQCSNEEDTENRNPNFSTPINQNKSKNFYDDYKEVIKSSAEKDEYSEIMLKSDEKPRLKAIHSAKDLFGGRDIFGKITEFCNELKKMAGTSKINSKERDDENLEERKEEEEIRHNHVLGSPLEKMNERDKERKPLLEVKIEGAGDRSTGKGKLRKNKILRAEDAENIPVSLDLNNVMREQKMSSIRMNPPTPQGFSATRDPIKGTPSKCPKSKLMERQIFQELEQNKTLREELNDRSDKEDASLVAVPAKEGRALDVFWFLKPCALSS